MSRECVCYMLSLMTHLMIITTSIHWNLNLQQWYHNTNKRKMYPTGAISICLISLPIGACGQQLLSPTPNAANKCNALKDFMIAYHCSCGLNAQDCRSFSTDPHTRVQIMHVT